MHHNYRAAVRCIVVGAGAWGLPAAAELAGRGHDVVLLDRHGIANPLSSSPGPTRL
jgi:sarcosine oxidase